MAFIITPNMSLSVPIVGQTSAPDYGLNINTCMDVIDQHDHSPGNGVQITPDGLDIISDLSLQSNNLLSVRSVKFSPQDSPIALIGDVGCLSVAGVDLYYNDVSGNIIRLTQGGSIVGTAGSIGGLTAPASASYNSGTGTFTWQQDVNKAAAMDNGPITLRKTTTSSPGITITPPSGLSSDYALTLPAAPPGATSIMRMDSSGNVSANLVPDDTSINIVSNVLQIPDGGVTPAKLSAAVIGSAAIAGSGTNITSTSFTTLTAMTFNITSSGLRPIQINLQPLNNGTGGGGLSFIRTNQGAATSQEAYLQIIRDDGTAWQFNIAAGGNLGGSISLYTPAGAIGIVDTAPDAGLRTYTLQGRVVSSGANIQYANLQMVGREV